MFEDTIVAISTSTIAAGAISIVRMSGKDATKILDKVFRTKDHHYEGYRFYYGHIFDPLTNKDIDEVLVSYFKAPRSYTGEDIVEINSHGGLYVTRKILTLLLANGARAAYNGEFTKRAFLNGRIDLTQAEAVNDLINADNKDNAQLAINSLEGSVSKLLLPLINDLEQCIAHIEVNIDYPEYDDNGIITSEQVSELLADWINKCDEILNVAESGQIIKEGIKTVIVGKPNVGKSSLLNCLLNNDKAIVSDVAGTTRDLVEGDVHLNNVTLHLIDTAGIHETENTIEKIGIKKSRQALDEAQLVVVVLDGSSELDEEDEQLLKETANKNRIIVYNKADLKAHEDKLSISAAKGEIKPLLDKINEMFESDRVALSQPTLTNERQISLMRQARESIMMAQDALMMGVPLDLVTEDIQNSYRCCKEILGQYSRDDLLDGIFSRFCLGK